MTQVASHELLYYGESEMVTLTQREEESPEGRVKNPEDGAKNHRGLFPDLQTKYTFSGWISKFHGSGV